jgi:hypothetical protein
MTSADHPENTVAHWFEQYKTAIESVGRLVIRAEAAEAESARLLVELRKANAAIDQLAQLCGRS